MRPPNNRHRPVFSGRRADRRRHIVSAMEDLLVDHSFHELTVTDVMTAAKLPRTTFYRCFDDIESVLAAGVELVGAEIAQASGDWLADLVDPAAEAAAGRQLVSVFARHGRLLRAFSERTHPSAPEAHTWSAGITSFVGPVTERITDLNRSGRAQVLHPAETARALVWMTAEYLVDVYGEGPGPAEPVAVETLAQIWRRTLFAN